MFKTIEDWQKLGKDQFEAASQSATAFTNGMQQIVTETSDYSRKSLESGTDLVQKLFGTRSLEGALQVQMDFAKSAYDSALSEATKLTTIMSTTAQDVFKPIEGVIAQAQSVARGA